MNLKEFKHLDSILFQDFQNNNDSAGSTCHFYKVNQNLNEKFNQNNCATEKNSTVKNITKKIINEEKQYRPNNNFDQNINHQKKHKRVFLFIVDALRLDFMVQTKKIKNDKNKNRDAHSIDIKFENIDNDENDQSKSIKNDKDDNTIEKDSEDTKDSKSAFSTTSFPISSTSTSKISSDSYNKMLKMHHLLLNNATQTALFGFRADPPTVTSQRLKGTSIKFIDSLTYLFVCYLFICLFSLFS